MFRIAYFNAVSGCDAEITFENQLAAKKFACILYAVHGLCVEIEEM